ncbi:uncharacterized protein PV06_08266 [Exophiala oligosperma]|uniref:Zn(2)-C6 fungal-type domain-containing protein n=1 Tax=Exophiala oligosperma TaxID=215243 RepID=A0A0D2DVY7_9EURO|nr:uncharacterized protein PV06_08266 [Exophiala oligosperma]KIW39674.1 hypothetical protein PV06_08266 [Exophiala oligosperma]
MSPALKGKFGSPVYFSSHMLNLPGDCRTCNRRRIRCDRTIPACWKCVSRRLSCPGYEKQLKWVCGAVSKGPYRRYYRPEEADVNLGEASGDQHVEDQRQARRITEWMTHDPSSTPWTEVYPLALFRTSLVEAQLSQPEVATLLNHFTEVVANQLVWYDDDANPWRKLIVPLALDSPTLLTTILAIACGNIVSRMRSDHHHTGSFFRSTQLHREKALRLLSKDFQTMSNLISTESWMPSHSHWGKATLASVIILSYLEIHFPTSGVWRLHLEAARQVIQAIQKPSISDRTTTFLAEELFATTTWALLTDYDADTSVSDQDLHISLDKDGPQPRQPEEMVTMPCQDSGFAGFCLVIRQITQTERLFQQSRIHGVPYIDTETRLVQIGRMLSEARRCALGSVRLEHLRRSKSEHLDASNLIDALYHSTSVYKFRALQFTSNEGSTVVSHRDQLFKSLQTFHDPESFAQDQTWPLFVAGTESKGDVTRQRWIRDRFQLIMSCSCELDRPRVMRFLESYWLQTDSENWVDYGRRQANQDRFLIL